MTTPPEKATHSLRIFSSPRVASVAGASGARGEYTSTAADVSTGAFNALAVRIGYNEREIGDAMPVVLIQVETKAGLGSTFPVVASMRAPGAVSSTARRFALCNHSADRAARRR